jgi:hypothetical protein
MIEIIQTLLNPSVFSALLILSGAVVVLSRKRLHASLALLFFIAGYFVIQIPLISELVITREQKYMAQGVISLCLIVLYCSLGVTLPLLLAAANEAILIAVNIVFLWFGFHEWYHWAIFGTVNYISFMLLCWNWGRRCRADNRGIHGPVEAGRMLDSWWSGGLQTVSNVAEKAQ